MENLKRQSNWMKRVRESLDVNNQVVSINSLNVIYMRVQPITAEMTSRVENDKASTLYGTGQRIFFNPYIDILPTDSIEFEGKVYGIKSYYKPRNKNNMPHHLEVTI